MTAHFFDIDGTLVHFHTHEWLPGAKEMLIDLSEKGDQIIFTTMRGPQDEGQPWSIENTYKLLDELNIKYTILFGIHTDRIIYNDNFCEAVRREHNQVWD